MGMPIINDVLNLNLVSNAYREKAQQIYRPILEKPQAVGEPLDVLAKTLDSMAQQAQQLKDYNMETEVMAGLQHLSNEAVINKWSPDEFEKQYQDFMETVQIDNPATRAKINRYAQLKYVDTLSKLHIEQQKEQFTQAVAVTQQFADKLQKSIIDKTSYQTALIEMKTRIENLTEHHIINPVVAQQYLEKFKKDAQNILFTQKIEENPQQFIADLKAGQYDDIVSDDASKDLLLRQAKAVYRQQELQQREEMKQHNSEMFYHYAVLLQNGSIGMTQIMQDNNIPDEVKYNLITLARSNITKDPDALKTYAELQHAVLNDQFSTFSDLNEKLFNLMKEGKLTASMYSSLARMYLVQHGSVHGVHNEAGEIAQIVRDPNYKALVNYTTAKAVSLANQIQQEASLAMGKTASIDSNLLKSTVKLLFLHFTERNNRLPNQNDINHIIYRSLYEPVYEDFKQNNMNIYKAWEKNDLGDLPSPIAQNITENIMQFLFKNYVFNPQTNTLRSLDLTDVLKDGAVVQIKQNLPQGLWKSVGKYIVWQVIPYSKGFGFFKSSQPVVVVKPRNETMYRKYVKYLKEHLSE